MSLSEHRQIENEMIFRQENEKVAKELEELKETFVNEGHPELTHADNIVIHLKCECSDENCEARIPISLHIYNTIHQNRKAFIIKKNHQVEAIETVIKAEEGYNIVEKTEIVADPGTTLNKTAVDNS